MPVRRNRQPKARCRESVNRDRAEAISLLPPGPCRIRMLGETHCPSPALQTWPGKNTEKSLPVSRRRCNSNHGRDLWTSCRTFWGGPRQGGGSTFSPQPCLTPRFSAPFSLPCPLPSPALSPVKMLRQRLALFMQKV